MIRASILAALATRGPMTIAELEEVLGVPRTLLRSVLTNEFYNQQEIIHPQHGKMTAWTPAVSMLRVDGDGRYHLGGNP